MEAWRGRGAHVRRQGRHWQKRLALFLAVVGPGLITSNVDNDAGGIATYSVVGAHFGYAMLWSLIPIAIALYVSEEICARMGVVTGKGLSDLIREEFGFRSTFFVMVAGLAVDLANTVAEFAGVATSLDLFGISKFVSVPLEAVLVWFVAVKGNYQSVEKIFLFACVIYVSYVIAGFLVKPDWKEAMIDSIRPKLMLDSGYIAMLIAMVGTTIAPWMQF